MDPFKGLLDCEVDFSRYHIRTSSAILSEKEFLTPNWKTGAIWNCQYSNIQIKGRLLLTLFVTCECEWMDWENQIRIVSDF